INTALVIAVALLAAEEAPRSRSASIECPPWSGPTRPGMTVAYAAKPGSSASSGNLKLEVLDESSGCLDATPYTVPIGWPTALAMHPSGRFLYVADRATASVLAFRIDARTGKLSQVGRYRIGNVSPGGYG